MKGVSRHDAHRTVALRRRPDPVCPGRPQDGTRVSVEFTIVPFTDNARRMIGIAAIMRDTTARFEELRTLRRQLALHPATNPSDDGNSGRDRQGR